MPKKLLTRRPGSIEDAVRFYVSRDIPRYTLLLVFERKRDRARQALAARFQHSSRLSMNGTSQKFRISLNHELITGTKLITGFRCEPTFA